MSTTLSPEARQMEKMIGKEAKVDEKNLQHLIKDLKHADKAAAKADKAIDKALHKVTKTVAKEHKTAEAIAKADHKHQVVLKDLSAAEKEVELKKRQQADLQADLAKKRAAVDEYERRKSLNDAQREGHLASIHTSAASAASNNASRVGSVDDGAPMVASPIGTTGTAGPTSASRSMEQPRSAV